MRRSSRSTRDRERKDRIKVDLDEIRSLLPTCATDKKMVTRNYCLKWRTQLFSAPAAIIMAWVRHSFASVGLCVSVNALNRKWLELSASKSVELYSMAGPSTDACEGKHSLDLVPLIQLLWLCAFYWPTILSVAPLSHCVICLSVVWHLSVVCDILYCGKMVHLS